MASGPAEERPMNVETKPLNLRLAGSDRLERAAAEFQQTGHLIRLLADYLVCPTRERVGHFMTALEEYQAEWIQRKSGGPK